LHSLQKGRTVCLFKLSTNKKEGLQIVIKYLQYTKGNKHKCASSEKDCNVHFGYKNETELGRLVEI
jgi:hypothetical protein